MVQLFGWSLNENLTGKINMKKDSTPTFSLMKLLKLQNLKLLFHSLDSGTRNHISFSQVYLSNAKSLWISFFAKMSRLSKIRLCWTLSIIFQILSLIKFTVTTKSMTHSSMNVTSYMTAPLGDPHQLGPVVFSSICRNFGLELSLMERLMTKEPLYEAKGNRNSNFIIKLVKNFRYPKYFIFLFAFEGCPPAGLGKGMLD